MDQERKATLGGFAAILLWSSTTLLLSLTASVPPILFLSLANFASFAVLSTRWVRRRVNPLPYFTGNFRVLLWTMFGLGFQPLCLVYAVRMIPVEEANLINYLWPMLTVLAVSALPGHKFRPEYIIGAAIGFGGAVLAILKPGTFVPDMTAGHLVALTGAVAWAVYSAGTRLMKRHPGDYNASGFLVNSVLLYFAHLLLEPSWSPEIWIVFLVLLQGSMSGAAYLLWDGAMKHGQAQIVSVASNSMPVLSTLYLIAFRQAAFSWMICLSALLILLGTSVASQEKLRAVFTKRVQARKSL